MTVSRRAFLGGVLATAACSGGSGSSSTTSRPRATSTTVALADNLPNDPFALGVASGDPDTESVALWTRLVGVPAGDHPVAWEVADDDSFRALVATGVAEATEALGHSVHVVAGGLDSGRTFHFRFRAGRFTSPSGTTRTAPEGDVSKLRLAVASCQDWQDGYWTAYPHLVADSPDIALWLGDFIYESPPIDGLVRLHNSPEPVDLAGYRLRYEQYLSDPGLRAARAALPWLMTWDDHEVVDNYTPSNVSEARRAAAYQAWYEHQPVRTDPPVGASLKLYRELHWGDLARFELLDTRQYRSDQVCGPAPIARCPEVNDPNRTLLGAEQQQWLFERLQSGDTAWTVLAQQVAMADLSFGSLINPDQWHGYEPQRQVVLDALRDVEGAVVLTGDLHASVAADVLLGVVPVAAEFITPSISSAFPSALAKEFGILEVTARGVRHAEALHHGYLLCTIDPDSWHTEFRVVDSVETPTASIETAAEFDVARTVPGVFS